MSFDLTTQYVSQSYQYLVQVSGSVLVDGLGQRIVALNAFDTGSYATTGSNLFNGDQIFSGSIQQYSDLSESTSFASNGRYTGIRFIPSVITTLYGVDAFFGTSSVETCNVEINAPRTGSGFFYIPRANEYTGILNYGNLVASTYGAKLHNTSNATVIGNRTQSPLIPGANQGNVSIVVTGSNDYVSNDTITCIGSTEVFLENASEYTLLNVTNIYASSSIDAPIGNNFYNSNLTRVWMGNSSTINLYGLGNNTINTLYDINNSDSITAILDGSTGNNVFNSISSGYQLSLIYSDTTHANIVHSQYITASYSASSHCTIDNSHNVTASFYDCDLCSVNYSTEITASFYQSTNVHIYGGLGSKTASLFSNNTNVYVFGTEPHNTPQSNTVYVANLHANAHANLSQSLQIPTALPPVAYTGSIYVTNDYIYVMTPSGAWRSASLF